MRELEEMTKIELKSVSGGGIGYVIGYVAGAIGGACTFLVNCASEYSATCD